MVAHQKHQQNVALLAPQPYLKRLLIRLKKPDWLLLIRQPKACYHLLVTVLLRPITLPVSQNAVSFLVVLMLESLFAGNLVEYQWSKLCNWDVWNFVLY